MVEGKWDLSLKNVSGFQRIIRMGECFLLQECQWPHQTFNVIFNCRTLIGNSSLVSAMAARMNV